MVVAIALSGAAHLGTVLGLPAAILGGGSSEPPAAVELELIYEAREASVVPREAPAPPPPSGPALGPPAARLASLTPSLLDRRPAFSPEVAASRSTVRGPPEPAAPPVEPGGNTMPVAPLLIDPLAAALSTFDTGEAPVDAPATAAALDRARGAALSEGLAREANRRPHVSERPPPALRHTRDGGYAFAGHVFEATIAPDGTVRFDDHANFAFNPLDPTTPGGLLPSGHFDLMDALERAHGNDPYRYEKEWFLEETRALRERLAAEWERRNGRRAIRRLEARLSRLWEGPRSAVHRRRALFALWDDCAEDDLGRRARRVIERFVRERLPPGSPDAYGRAELDALNGARGSSEAFAPHADRP